MKYLIHWENNSSNSFLFGSEIALKGQSVSFSNLRMPPGQYVKTWFSKTNYQSNRISPSLPLLHRGKTYYLELCAEMSPKNSLYLKISFQDRFGQAIDFVILKDDKGEFLYPEEAYSYTIELFNAGCEHLLFHYLVLYDEEERLEQSTNDWDPAAIHHLVNPDSPNKDLYVIFMESSDTPLTKEERRVFEIMGQVLLVGDAKAVDTYYLLPAFLNYLQDIIKDLEFDRLYFVGHGPIGNFAAAYYSREYKDSIAYVTSQVYDSAVYQASLEKASLGEYFAEGILYRLEHGKNVFSYDRKSDDIFRIFDSLYFPLLTFAQYLKNKLGREKRQ